MGQKWYILPAKMKCNNCGDESIGLLRQYRELGAGTCPKCGVTHVKLGPGKVQLRKRLHLN